MPQQSSSIIKTLLPIEQTFNKATTSISGFTNEGQSFSRSI